MKGPGGGLALLLGLKKGPKGKSDEVEEDEDDEAGGDTDDLLREAYAAIRDKDEEGFIASMKAAIKECNEE